MDFNIFKVLTKEQKEEIGNIIVEKIKRDIEKIDFSKMIENVIEDESIISECLYSFQDEIGEAITDVIIKTLNEKF